MLVGKSRPMYAITAGIDKKERSTRNGLAKAICKGLSENPLTEKAWKEIDYNIVDNGKEVVDEDSWVSSELVAGSVEGVFVDIYLHLSHEDKQHFMTIKTLRENEQGYADMGAIAGLSVSLAHEFLWYRYDLDKD